MDGAPDCRACGACCTSSSPEHAPVTGDDWARLGDDVERWAVFLGQRAFLRMRDGRCAALTGVGGAFHCAIYERRPAVCRELERGSPACHAEIARKGERARRMLPLLSR